MVIGVNFSYRPLVVFAILFCVASIPMHSGSFNANLSANQEGGPELISTSTICHYADGSHKEIGQSEKALSAIDTTPPLSRNTMVISPMEEIAIIDYVTGGNSIPYVLDDAYESFERSAALDSPDVYHAIVSGNFGTDEYDEILVFSGFGGITIYDDAVHSYPKILDKGYGVDSTPKVLTADVDGDYIDEILLLTIADAVMGSTLKVSLIDDIFDDSSYTVSWSHAITDWVLGSSEANFAAGNLDSDIHEEIVVVADDTGGHSAWVLDYGSGAMVSYELSGTGFTPTLAIGNFDYDPRFEIAISAGSHTSGQNVYILDDIDSGLNIIASDLGIMNLYKAQIAAGQLDADYCDELVTFGLVPDDYDEYQGYVIDDFSNPTYPKNWSVGEFDAEYLGMGDVDCDGMDEIAMSHKLGTTYILDDSLSNYTVLLENSNVAGIFSFGEFDCDGVKVGYTGAYQDNLGPPGVMLAMASPPTYPDDYQVAGSYTAFGQQTSVGSTETNWMGLRVSVTVSYETGDPFSLFKAKFSATFSSEFKKTQSVTSVETQEISFRNGVESDAVIYETTWYRSFIYEILIHPTSPEREGQNMTIDIPYETNVFKSDLIWFNEHFANSTNGGISPFQHELGHPETYTSKMEMESMSEDMLQSQQQTIGNANGYNIVTMRLDEMTSSESSYEVGMDVAVGASIGGLGLEVSFGVFGGYAYAIEYGQGVVYEGAIGDVVDSDEWMHLNFRWGLFVYNKTDDPSGILYQVIDYYQDGAQPLNPSLFANPLIYLRDLIRNPTETIQRYPLEFATLVGGIAAVIIVVVLLAKRLR